MPDPITGAIGSAIIGAGSARSAARSQERAANRDIEFQTETRDLIRSDLSGYRDIGSNANAALMFELGLGPRPTFGGTAPSIETIAGTPGSNALGSQRGLGGTADGGWYRENAQNARPSGGTPETYRVGGQTFGTMAEAQSYAGDNRTAGQEYAGFTGTPGYDFRLNQGMDSLQSSAAARGGLLSGSALQASQQFGQDYGSAEYGNFFNRLAGQQGVGLSASAMNATAAQNAATGVSNALGNLGNAQAAGAIGVGNAIQGGIGNVFGTWNYQRQQQQQPANSNWLTMGRG